MEFEVCDWHYDLDVLLAEHERLKVEFTQNVAWCGLLFNNSLSSSTLEFTSSSSEIMANSSLKIPIWQAKMLKEAKTTCNLVKFPQFNLHQHHHLIHEMQANAQNVDFYAKNCYFSLVVAWISKLEGNYALFSELIRALQQRSVGIFYQSLRKGAVGEVAFWQKLDLIERAFLKALVKSACE